MTRISMIGQRAFLVLVCMGIWFSGANRVQADVGFQPSLNDATLEKYDGVQLVSRIHVTRTFIDHEKWGFFKIALAPIGVVQGVNFQVRSAGSLTNALDSINSCNLSADERHLELRDIQISLLSENTPRLRAASARLNEPGKLELSHVSAVNGDGKTISIARATLPISGPDCGCLYWNDAGHPRQLSVFQLLKN
jgi:hypothetical protein